MFFLPFFLKIFCIYLYLGCYVDFQYCFLSLYFVPSLSCKLDKLQAYAVAKGHASRAGPTQALKETLEALCSDEKNVRIWLSLPHINLLCIYVK